MKKLVFPQNFHTRKLREITVFYTVSDGVVCENSWRLLVNYFGKQRSQHEKMNFPQFLADLVTFIKEILNEKLHLLCSGSQIAHRTLTRSRCCPSMYNFVKSVRIRSFSYPHFPAFGLNMDRYFVSLRFLYECGKMQT